MTTNTDETENSTESTTTPSDVASDSVAPTPTSLARFMSVDDADNPLGELNNREKAYAVHQWIREHRHVIAVDDIFYAYSDGVWTPSGAQQLLELTYALLGVEASKHILNEVYERVRASDTIERSQLGTPPGTIATQNGLLDLHTRTLRPLRPDDYAIRQINAPYDEDASCPEWEAFLDRILPPTGQRRFEEAMGLSLVTDDFPTHRAITLVGTGRNGKSTALRVLTALLGPDNVCAQSLQKISHDQFARAELDGKLANIDPDLTADGLKRTSRFKALTGGDTVAARPIYESAVEFENTATLVFAANELPAVEIDDSAFYRRWIVIECPHRIDDDERIPQDKLVKSLTAELPGILNKALDGLDRLRDSGQFTDERPVAEKEARWQEWGSPIDRFKRECIVVRSGGKLPKQDLYAIFVAFCDDNELTPVSQSKLTKELKQVAGIDDGQRRFNGTKTNAYVGVELTERGQAIAERLQSDD